eukprot:scaffold2815_cov113-Isochrysis_galbana.AAC.13
MAGASRAHAVAGRGRGGTRAQDWLGRTTPRSRRLPGQKTCGARSARMRRAGCRRMKRWCGSTGGWCVGTSHEEASGQTARTIRELKTEDGWRSIWIELSWYPWASDITTTCRFTSMGVGTEKPLLCSADMKANSFSAERRLM